MSLWFFQTVVLVALVGSGASWASEWPEIRPLEREFVIADPTHPVVLATISDRRGTPMYLFICRDADDPSGPESVWYAGDLDCRLIPAELGEVEVNLLVEEPSLAAWYSRGRMFADHLAGDCADYPEYGRVRHFRLRAMRLTLEFFDVQFASGESDPTLSSYKLRLTVEPDTEAKTEIAESSGYLDPHRQVPGRGCDVIQKGDEWGGS